ncbi:hypothetical protein [Allosphingosinicella humi]
MTELEADKGHSTPPWWIRWAHVYVASVVAFSPWAFLMARDDGRAGNFLWVSAYALVGTVLPSLLILLVIRKSPSWRLYGFLLAAVLGAMAYRGH